MCCDTSESGEGLLVDEDARSSDERADTDVGAGDNRSVLTVFLEGASTTAGSSNVAEGDRELLVFRVSDDATVILECASSEMLGIVVVVVALSLDEEPNVVSVGLAPLDDSDRTLAFGRFGGMDDVATVAFDSRGDGDKAGAGLAAQ
jgi:hypothetical protein